MRAMHFVPYFPPERIGGVGEFVADLHSGLLQCGDDSQVVTTGVKPEGPVHRIARSRLGWFLSTLCWIGEAARCDVGRLLVPVDDPAAMATACLRLLQAPDLTAALGEAGRRAVAERFDLDRQADAYLHYHWALSKEAP